MSQKDLSQEPEMEEIKDLGSKQGESFNTDMVRESSPETKLFELVPSDKLGLLPQTVKFSNALLGSKTLAEFNQYENERVTEGSLI